MHKHGKIDNSCAKYMWDLNSYDMFGLVLFKATFNNISVISWRSDLLVEETGGPGENHQHIVSH